MRSLFTKILLWFVATTFLTSLGVAITSAIVFENAEPRRPPFPFFMTRQLNEARAAYETGGAAALGATLQRLRHMDRSDVYFTDASGRDLLTGADRASLLPGTRRFLLSIFRRRPLAHPSDDGKYFLILAGPRRPGVFWFLRTQHLWVLGLAVLLCYALAYHLSSTVRQLQRSVDRFGHGDFSARAGSTRGDELGQLARTFDQMADRIEGLLTSERRLLLDISHELRSPLARLSVAVELARSDRDPSATLDRIQREADRLNELIGGLLEVTRAEVDPSSQHREPVQLNSLVSQVAEDCRIEATAKDCSLRVARLEEAELDGDAELLRRAVENVLRNAIRYAPSNTTIEMSLEHAPGGVAIAIRDQGPGVPEDALKHIFDPFYRVDTARVRSSGGAGLGLSIARRAVELHGGTLKARNAQPGLEVTIRLPLVRLENIDSARQREKTLG